MNRVLYLIFIGLILFFIGFILYLNSSEMLILPKLKNREQEKLLHTYWENSDYDEIILYSDNCLDKTPLDKKCLFYNGAANFYKAVTYYNHEEQISFLDRAISQLRRLLVLSPEESQGVIEYLLGKSYYHRGYYYYDLATFYLKESLDLGYFNDDIYEFIGASYAGLGFKEKAALYYEKAIAEFPSSILYLEIADIYISQNSLKKAEGALLEVFTISKNQFDTQTAMFKLSQIYYRTGRYLEALDMLTELIEISGTKDSNYPSYLSLLERVNQEFLP